MTKSFGRLGASGSVPLRAVIDNPDLAVEAVPDSLGAGALDRPVRWAHVSELRDPAPYLLGEELLLTAGVNLAERSQDIDGYVRDLRDSGISALGFGVTPPMHEGLPPDLRQACVRHRLPLLVIPPSTPFLAVSRAVAVEISDAAQRDQHRINDAREALTDATDNGVDGLLRELAGRLAGWAALVGPDGAVSAQHRAPSPLPKEAADLLGKLRGGTGRRSATTELADGTVVVAQPVAPRASTSDQVVVGRGGRFDAIDRAILAVGAALLGLVGRTGSEPDVIGSALTGLLLDESGPDDVLGAVLGPGDYVLISGTARVPGDAAHDWLRARLGTPLVRFGPDGRFTAIGTAVPGRALLDELHAAGWLVAVGSARPATRLPEGVPELEVLTQRARSLGYPVVAETHGLGLSSLVPQPTATRFADRVLAPIVELDDSRGWSLLTTLRTWLAQHGNWDRTATALGIHRNSVRRRIAQVERALGADLGDAQHRMELWFALQWSSRQ